MQAALPGGMVISDPFFSTGAAPAIRTLGAENMSTSEPAASRPSEDRATPDRLLHARTGTDVSPEDLVLASGKDITPRNIEWAKRKLAAEGPAALDKLLP